MSPLLTFNLKVGFTFSVLSKYHVPTGIGFRRRRDMPLAYFQCNDKLLFVSKHAKGISYVMMQFILTPFVIDLNNYYKRVEKIWKKENKSLSLK